jgi:MinD superfamily P-loop ATPase
MIAVVGAKGGCGKTVTTLGIAEAFARAGIPSLAIDADRQLPDLHTLGGVDREPTLAELSADQESSRLAQRNPRQDSSGIITACEDCDLKAKLQYIEHDSTQVIVDCPPGAGPDVIEPVSATDRVVVVTTDTQTSIESCHTSITIAKRLGVPVAGVILNRCTTPPDSLAATLDAPVLAAVPERGSPLTDTAVCDAYDVAAAGLSERISDSRARKQSSPRTKRTARQPTGIDELDRRLGGGLTPGTTVVVEGGSRSQASNILSRLAANRDTLYLTTRDSAEDIQSTVSAAGPNATQTNVTELEASERLTQATDMVEQLPNETLLIIDTADELEQSDRTAYLTFLNTLVTRVRSTGSTAVVRCPDATSRPANRSSTKHFSDIVITL